MKVNEVKKEFCVKFCAAGRFYDDHGCRCQDPDDICQHPYPNNFTRAQTEAGKKR